MNKTIDQAGKKIRSFFEELELGRYLQKSYYNYSVLFVALILGVYLRWNTGAITVFLFLIWNFLNPMGSRLLAKLAILFLFLSLIFLLINRSQSAELAALFAYISLVVSLVTSLLENVKSKGTIR